MAAVLRLAFHDAGTYDAASKTGGANGSIVFEARLLRASHLLPLPLQFQLLFSEPARPAPPLVHQLDRPESFGLKRGLRPVQDAKELLRGTAAEVRRGP